MKAGVEEGEGGDKERKNLMKKKNFTVYLYMILQDSDLQQDNCGFNCIPAYLFLLFRINLNKHIHAKIYICTCS